MTRGRVYLYEPPDNLEQVGNVAARIVGLNNLDEPKNGHSSLCGRHVRVHNVGVINVPGADGGTVALPLGDAESDPQGDFLFEPGRGGGRIDKVETAEPDFRWRYTQAARFGEVNVYYHVDRMAAYIAELLVCLGAEALPSVTAMVNAHHAATTMPGSSVRDGVQGRRQWLPFQGAHYRLPGKAIAIAEHQPISIDGEIHFGPGWRLLEHGALVQAAGSKYRANASHNAGIIYHEYGHHVVRHTADLRGNSHRPAAQQDNKKSALDEGTSDYLAATMLATPHIWALHQRHDHPRSLVSARTMADFDRSRNADPHANGTIWAAALWDLRARLAGGNPDGARTTDLLVLKTLLILGEHRLRAPKLLDPGKTFRPRVGFSKALAAMLEADTVLHGARHHAAIQGVFSRRGIKPASSAEVSGRHRNSDAAGTHVGPGGCAS